MKDISQFRIGVVLIILACPWAISIVNNSFCGISNHCFNELIDLPFWISLPSMLSGITGMIFVFTSEEKKEKKHEQN